MKYFVLVAWVIQASVGLWLLTGWWRHGRPSPIAALGHVGLVLPALVLWIAFVLTGALAPAWIAFALITIGLGFGDALLVRRSRGQSGLSVGFWNDYGSAIGAVFRGRMPRRVVFHALFSPVVYFSCLGVCIGATVAAA